MVEDSTNMVLRSGTMKHTQTLQPSESQQQVFATTNFNRLSIRVENVETQLENVKSRLDKLEKKVDHLDTKVDKLEAKFDAKFDALDRCLSLLVFRMHLISRRLILQLLLWLKISTGI